MKSPLCTVAFCFPSYNHLTFIHPVSSFSNENETKRTTFTTPRMAMTAWPTNTKRSASFCIVCFPFHNRLTFLPISLINFPETPVKKGVSFDAPPMCSTPLSLVPSAPFSAFLSLSHSFLSACAHFATHSPSPISFCSFLPPLIPLAFIPFPPPTLFFFISSLSSFHPSFISSISRYLFMRALSFLLLPLLHFLIITVPFYLSSFLWDSFQVMWFVIFFNLLSVSPFP